MFWALKLAWLRGVHRHALTGVLETMNWPQFAGHHATEARCRAERQIPCTFGRSLCLDWGSWALIESIAPQALELYMYGWIVVVVLPTGNFRRSFSEISLVF